MGEPEETLTATSRPLPAQDDVVFQGCLVHATPEEEMVILENWSIGVREGKILFLEPSSHVTEAMAKNHMSPDRLTKLSDRQFLMPGFVDCHAHASQYSFLGTGTDQEDLLAWLSKYPFPTERQLSLEPDHGYSMYTKCVDRTLRNGTTTISYYATIDRLSTLALVRAVESRGQRAFVGKVNMDTNSPEDYVETREESVKETERFVAELIERKNPLVQPCITPRFALSCTVGLMKDLSMIACKDKLPIQTHLSENITEIQEVSRTFPDCHSYSHVYDHVGLLGPRTMLAHAVHVSRQELDLIRERQCGICHCANSNFSLGSGMMNLRRAMDSGVKVGLGTDFGAGYSPSMLDAIRRGLDAAKMTDFYRRHNNYSNSNTTTTTTANNNSSDTTTNNNNNNDSNTTTTTTSANNNNSNTTTTTTANNNNNSNTTTTTTANNNNSDITTTTANNNDSDTTTTTTANNNNSNTTTTTANNNNNNDTTTNNNNNSNKDNIHIISNNTVQDNCNMMDNEEDDEDRNDDNDNGNDCCQPGLHQQQQQQQQQQPIQPPSHMPPQQQQQQQEQQEQIQILHSPQHGNKQQNQQQQQQQQQSQPPPQELKEHPHQQPHHHHQQQQQQHQQQQATQSELTSSHPHKPTAINYKHLFRLATLGSSQVMGLDHVIGNFQMGKDFDAILVDVSTFDSPIDVFPADTREDEVQKFIFLGDDRNIIRVYVQGRQVVQRSDSPTVL